MNSVYWGNEKTLYIKWIFGVFIPHIDKNNMELTIYYVKRSETFLLLRGCSRLKEAKGTRQLNAMCVLNFFFLFKTLIGQWQDPNKSCRLDSIIMYVNFLIFKIRNTFLHKRMFLIILKKHIEIFKGAARLQSTLKQFWIGEEERESKCFKNVDIWEILERSRKDWELLTLSWNFSTNLKLCQNK